LIPKLFTDVISIATVIKGVEVGEGFERGRISLQVTITRFVWRGGGKARKISVRTGKSPVEIGKDYFPNIKGTKLSIKTCPGLN
jgi:hypothetical protein